VETKWGRVELQLTLPGKEEIMVTASEKKQPDYTSSAVKLCNPDEVKMELNIYLQLQIDAAELQEKLEKLPEYQEWAELTAKAVQQKTRVKEAVEQFGSYQDIENGVYALMQTRHTKVYHAEPFLEHFSKYAPAVVEQNINVKTLDGMIKGKVLQESELMEYGVITETETFAFILKTE